MNNDKLLKKQNENEIININKIKQSVLCCTYCGKSYKSKITLDKHFILCEITNKLKSKPSNEDDNILPSQKQMYQIIIDLVLKCNRLESKVDHLSSFISKKINKINIVDYLSSIKKPQSLFDNFNETMNVEQSDVEYLFHNSFKDTFSNILSRTLNKNIEMSETLPFVSFVEKVNIIYIYTVNSTYNDNNSVQNYGWIIAPREKIIRFLNIIQLKMSKALSEWRKNNLCLLNENDGKSILYDKTYSKLIGVNFKIDDNYNKFYSIIYHKVKKEL
jgi:hypothetical protein